MELIEMIAQVGFPIAVSVYLLIKFEATIDRNTEAINSLANALKDSAISDAIKRVQGVAK